MKVCDELGIPFIPDIKLKNVFEITPALLHRQGITLLLMDLDNTLLPYSLEYPGEELLNWIKCIRDSGIKLFIVSNNRGTRPEKIAPRLGIDYVAKAKKPNPREILKAMRRFNKKAGETALVGDQVYIDAFAAYRAEITSIVVDPIRLENPLLALRYFAEFPFRAMRRKGER